MSKILGIRVMAQTFDENDVAGAWPNLCSLAWPEWSKRRGLDGVGLKPGAASGPGPVEQALGAGGHGVVELAEALADLVRFGDLDPKAREAIKEPVREAEQVKRDLDKALGDWDAQRALKLTDALEEALTRAEDAF